MSAAVSEVGKREGAKKATRYLELVLAVVFGTVAIVVNTDPPACHGCTGNRQ